MQGKPERTRLTVRADFGEAAARAKALAKASGEEISVRRGPSGFEIWVPEIAYPKLAELLEEFEEFEALCEEEENEQMADDGLDDIPDVDDPDDSYEDYQDEVASEILDDIEDERENWAASEEEGWFYRD